MDCNKTMYLIQVLQISVLKIKIQIKATTFVIYRLKLKGYMGNMPKLK